MVHLVSDQICRAEYRRLFLRAAADDHGGRCADPFAGGGAGNPVPGKIFLRPCAGGLHDGDSASSDYRQPHHAEPWRHRNLYCEDLRGSQGKTAVFYREKDQRQEKRQLKKTSHFHHSDEGETSFFMKLVFLPVIAFRGRGITADVFAVDEAVSLYFIVV